MITKHNAYAKIGHEVVCGELTTEHSASSYGLPVFVSADDPRCRPEHRQEVLGPAECESVSLGMELEYLDRADEVAKFIDRVRSAGYVVVDV